MYKTFRIFFLLLPLTALLAGPLAGARLIVPYKKAKSVVLPSRAIARVPTLTLTSLGLNYESYIFEIDSHGPDNVTTLIKVSYRFHLGESTIPAALMDYSLIHKFRMVRDAACDEPWDSISTRYFFDRQDNYVGTGSALLYSANAPNVNPGKQTVLPCYVITPRDYQSSRTVQNPVVKVHADDSIKKPIASGAQNKL